MSTTSYRLAPAAGPRDRPELTFAHPAGGINENGTVYLDYPDIGISQMEVIGILSAGKRTVRMTL